LHHKTTGAAGSTPRPRQGNSNENQFKSEASSEQGREAVNLDSDMALLLAFRRTRRGQPEDLKYFSSQGLAEIAGSRFEPLLQALGRYGHSHAGELPILLPSILSLACGAEAGSLLREVLDLLDRE